MWIKSGFSKDSQRRLFRIASRWRFCRSSCSTGRWELQDPWTHQAVRVFIGSTHPKKQKLVEAPLREILPRWTFPPKKSRSHQWGFSSLNLCKKIISGVYESWGLMLKFLEGLQVNRPTGLAGKRWFELQTHENSWPLFMTLLAPVLMIWIRDKIVV